MRKSSRLFDSAPTSPPLRAPNPVPATDRASCGPLSPGRAVEEMVVITEESAEWLMQPQQHLILIESR
jgi:hypothetical protein